VAEIKTFTDANPGLFVNLETITAAGSSSQRA